jgi:hypothetical protein
MAYKFYYDESSHSESITENTLNAENFYDNFITVIVGWDETHESALETKYLAFEEKYKSRKAGNPPELKSSTIKIGDVVNGFASIKNRELANLIEDYLSLFDENIHVCISFTNKIEFLVNQIIDGYDNRFYIDENALKYTLVKALRTYKPQNVIAQLYQDPSNIVDSIKAFLEERIKINDENPKLKQIENQVFREVILVLDKVSPLKDVTWDYTAPFMGFSKYLNHKGITDYSLILDKEGTERTLNSAQKCGLKSVSEGDSLNHFGIRMADMLAGIIFKLSKSLFNALNSRNPDSRPQKLILNEEWFKLSNQELNVYKLLHKVILDLNEDEMKRTVGTFYDDLICFQALIQYMNSFASASDITKGLEMRGEWFNTFCCEYLENYFKTI